MAADECPAAGRLAALLLSGRRSFSRLRRAYTQRSLIDCTLALVSLIAACANHGTVKLDQVAEPRIRCRGSWTIEKREFLEKLCEVAYARALQNKPFYLMYIDAFAGTGYEKLIQEDSDASDCHARFPVQEHAHARDKQFDRLGFVENDPRRCEELDVHLREEHRYRDTYGIERRGCKRMSEQFPPALARQWHGVHRFWRPLATAS